MSGDDRRMLFYQLAIAPGSGGVRAAIRDAVARYCVDLNDEEKNALTEAAYTAVEKSDHALHSREHFRGDGGMMDEPEDADKLRDAIRVVGAILDDLSPDSRVSFLGDIGKRYCDCCGEANCPRIERIRAEDNPAPAP